MFRQRQYRKLSSNPAMSAGCCFSCCGKQRLWCEKHYFMWWSLKVQHVCFASRVSSSEGRNNMALLKQLETLALFPCSSITVCIVYLICKILTLWLFFTATPRGLSIVAITFSKPVPMSLMLIREATSPSPAANSHKLTLGFICIMIWFGLCWEVGSSLFGQR